MQTSPNDNLVPPPSLPLSNSFASLPVMDYVIPQEKKICYA